MKTYENIFRKKSSEMINGMIKSIWNKAAEKDGFKSIEITFLCSVLKYHVRLFKGIIQTCDYLTYEDYNYDRETYFRIYCNECGFSVEDE